LSIFSNPLLRYLFFRYTYGKNVRGTLKMNMCFKSYYTYYGGENRERPCANVIAEVSKSQFDTFFFKNRKCNKKVGLFFTYTLLGMHKFEIKLFKVILCAPEHICSIPSDIHRPIIYA